MQKNQKNPNTTNTRNNNPVIIHVPHSSTYIPPDEMQYFTTLHLQRELNVMTDHYCDDLYDSAAEMIRFPISRLVCDPERFRDDRDEIMSRVGMGAVYTSCSDGEELKRVPDNHREEIMTRYYDSHHSRLESAVSDRLDRFGKCLIIDGHSFYDTPLPYESDQDTDRPDICIGTDSYHTPGKIEVTLCDHFLKRGYSVEFNRPFAGSLVPLKYYRKDRRVMSVMIEINRRLYIDHDINKTENYQRVKNDVQTVTDLLIEELLQPSM